MATNDEDLTVWVGGLDSKVTTEILWELFVQAGPLADVRLPKDKETGEPRNFAFIAFKHTVSGPYAERLFNGIQLFEKTIRVRYKGTSKFDQDQYHELYEKLLDRLVVENPKKYAGVFEELEQVKSRNMTYDDRSNPMYHHQQQPPPPPRHHPYQEHTRRSYDHSPAPSTGGRSHRDDRSFYNDRYSDSRSKGSGYNNRDRRSNDESYYRQRGSRF